MHKRHKLIGTQIIKNTEIRDGDSIELGKWEDWDKNKCVETSKESAVGSFNWKDAVGTEELDTESETEDQEIYPIYSDTLWTLDWTESQK